MLIREMQVRLLCSEQPGGDLVFTGKGEIADRHWLVGNLNQPAITPPG
ncbi:hypothetical protein [Spirosoma pomorum]